MDSPCCPCEVKCVMCTEHSIHKDLSLDAACLVREMMIKEEYQKGDMLFQENDPATYLFNLSSGQVKLTYNTFDGREQIIGMGAPGYLLGFHSLHDESYSYTACAMMETHVCKIQHKSILKQLEDHPDVALRIIDALNCELSQSRELLRVMGHKTAAEKTAAFILSMMPRNQSTDKKFDLPFSRSEIANFLGLSSETVCRVMADFKRAGILNAPRGSVVVRDSSRLHDIANGVIVSGINGN